MTPQEMQKILEQSFADMRFSRTEKSALRHRLADEDPDIQQLLHFRSMAFDIAKRAIDATNGSMVVSWLEDVVRILHQPSDDHSQEVSEAWFSPRDNCPQRIRAFLAQARRSVEVCVYTITDDRLTSAILDAHRRGTQVRIITDNDKALDAGSDAQRLLEAGVSLRTDRSDYHMHHKFAVVDGSLLLSGSYNWTRGAAENNEENFVITSNRTLVASYGKHFEDMWQKL